MSGWLSVDRETPVYVNRQVGGRMSGWMRGRTFEEIGGYVKGQECAQTLSAWIDGLVCGWTAGCVDRRMDSQGNERMMDK